MIISAFINLLLCNFLFGGTWTITQLSNGGSYPSISGTNVVWYRSGEIHSNFAGQITDNNVQDKWPSLSGTNVVWTTYEDNPFESVINSNFAGQISTSSSTWNRGPSISGTNVVWIAHDGHDDEIYSNFAGKLTNIDGKDDEPSISGTNVVWRHQKYNYDLMNFEYHIYSNFDGQLNSSSITENRYPSISGTNVVWQGYDGEDWEIYSNFAGQLTNNDTDDTYPSISGTNVAWCHNDGHDSEVYTNFGGQITETSQSEIWPSISGTTVVWEMSGYGGEIYMATYDETAVVPIPSAGLLGCLGLSIAGMKLRKFA